MPCAALAHINQVNMVGKRRELTVYFPLTKLTILVTELEPANFPCINIANGRVFIFNDLEYALSHCKII